MSGDANQPVIVSGVRTAIARAPRGALRSTRPDDIAAATIHAAICGLDGLNPAEVEDVILGCASPEAEQGLNIARVAALRAGLPLTVPGLTLNRFCASGLEAIAVAAAKVATGQATLIVAGGVESMSMVPFMGDTLRPNPYLVEKAPDTYLPMGLSVERLANTYGVTREASDSLALESHRRALAAQDSGAFADEIVPIQPASEPGSAMPAPFIKDEGPRRDTSMEALAALKPAFREDGVITAGNASPRSDGAAAVVVTSRGVADARGWPILAAFAGYATAAVAPADFGIAPAHAIPALLAKIGRTLSDIDLIEFNEAFAAQVLAADKLYPLPMERVNVNGGAVALGHPLGATGARQTVTLLHEARRRGSRCGIVTMCAALGMGAAALFEFDR
ncbi:MAG TPA: thiolase family protein [Chthonomonadaceae bacterium]|nr:thiolase family protein [Chthonomonadaceae bacterium]